MNIALLQMKAVASSNGGALVSWNTDPGPDDLAGYRLDKRVAGSEWQTLVALTTSTSFVDTEEAAGSEYRLWGINGLGQELVLGEARFGVSASLAAWPLPYRAGASGGALTVSFSIYGRLGATQGNVQVALYDVRGRHVRTIAQGNYGQGSNTVTWDGTDASGQAVPAGVYLLRSTSSEYVESLKFIVTR